MKNKIQKNKYRLRTPFKRSGLVWFLAFVLLGTHVFFAVQNSSSGAKIAVLEDEIKVLERENESLSKSLMDTTSLTKLENNAENLSYGKIENTLYIAVGDSFAKAR